MTPVASTPRPSRSGAGRPRNQTSVVGTPTPRVPASEPPKKKLRYIPGGPGGGGRYVDEDGTEIPVGGTGPGGQNYVGPRGPIGRANAAAGLVPIVHSPKARTPRPSRNTPSRSRLPTTPRFATAAHASAVLVQSEDYKPREERAMEEFHPDLDIFTSLKVFSADEVDGNVQDRPITPAAPSSATNGSINGTNGIAASISAASSSNGDTTPSGTASGEVPRKRGPGRPPRDPVKFYAERAAKAGTVGPIATIPTTPKASRITPLPNQTAKERLTLPQPSYRKVLDFPKYKGDSPETEKNMVEMGYRVKDRFGRPEHRYTRTEDSMVPGGAFRVEYDMDEDDAGWLTVVNRKRKEANLTPIPFEVFEIVITKIELEWYTLEKRIPKPNPKPPQTHRPRSSSAAAVNGEPQAGEEQDSKCAICDDGDCENTNAIVFCDGCDLAVHQDCYGVPFIPEGQWLCRKCHVIGSGVPTCLFCPNVDGAFKQTTSNKWGHLLCAMWIPEVTLGNHSFMEPIQDVEKVPRQRWELKCYICKQNMGACVQCGNRNCYEAFHVTCARKAKLYLKMKNASGALSVLDGSSPLKAFCHRHGPKDYQRDVDVVQSLEDAIEFYKRTMKGRLWASSSALALKKQKLENSVNQSQATGARIAQAAAGHKSGKKNQIVWRLDSGAPVIPKVILEKVIKDMEPFNTQNNEDFITEMARFWTLKRENRGGAPLIKHLSQTETSTALEMTRRNFPAMGPLGRPRLHRRKGFGEMIYSELDHLTKIIDSFKQIQNTNLEIAKLEADTVDLIYFPLQPYLKQVIDTAISSDESNTYKAGLSEIRQKVHSRYYVSCFPLARDLSILIYSLAATKPIAIAERPIDERRTSKRKRSEIDEEAVKIAEKNKDYRTAIFEACTGPFIRAVQVEAAIRKKDLEKMAADLKAILAGDTKVADYDSDEDTIIDTSIKVTKTEESSEFVSAANSNSGQDTEMAEEPKPYVSSTGIEATATVTSVAPSIHSDLHDEDAEGEEVDDEDVFAPVPTGSPHVMREHPPAPAIDPTQNGQSGDSHGNANSINSKSSFTPPDTNGSVGSETSLPERPLVDPPTPASSTTTSTHSNACISLANGGSMWYLQDFKPVGTSVIDIEPAISEREASEELTDIDEEQLKALGPDVDADGDVEMEEAEEPSEEISMPSAKKSARKVRAKAKVK